MQEVAKDIGFTITLGDKTEVFVLYLDFIVRKQAKLVNIAEVSNRSI